MGTLQIVTETAVTVPIDLGDLVEEWRGAVFEVWVTPTRAHLEALNAYHTWVAENIPDPESDEGKAHYEKLGEEKTAAIFAEADARLDAWLAESWRNLPLEEVTQLREHIQEIDQHIWNWLYRRTIDVMTGYRQALVKNSLAPLTDT
jgi:hypothetical protein